MNQIVLLAALVSLKLLYHVCVDECCIDMGGLPLSEPSFDHGTGGIRLKLKENMGTTLSKGGTLAELACFFVKSNVATALTQDEMDVIAILGHSGNFDIIFVGVKVVSLLVHVPQAGV
jgi:hypothetical protein